MHVGRRVRPRFGLCCLLLAALSIDARSDVEAGIDDATQAVVEHLDAMQYSTGPRDVVPLVRVNPGYPRKMYEARKDGWVGMCVSTDTQGNVADAVVVGHSGNGEFDASALHAIRQWKYEPERLDGEPVERHGLSIVLRFTMEEDARSKEQQFMNAMHQVGVLIDAGNFDVAEALLFGVGPPSGEGASRILLARATLSGAKNDTNAERLALNRLVDEIAAIRTDLVPTILRRALAVDLQLGQVGSALRDCSELERRAGAGLTGGERDQCEQIAALSEQGATLQSQAVLALEGAPNSYCPEFARWPAFLLRHRFGFEAPKGQIDSFYVQCQTPTGSRRVGLRFSTDRRWEIPADWNSCSLDVRGMRGSTFTLVEYADASHE